MKTIIALTDYKGYFGSKDITKPYRSGFDKNLLSKHFGLLGYNLSFVPFNVSLNSKFPKDSIIIYTSSEDSNLYYKSYIIDVIYGLYLKGFRVIPDFKYLLAHDNKVFMEVLMDIYLKPKIGSLSTSSYGSLNELDSKMPFPKVIKPSKGSMSKGVSIVENENELFRKAKKISRSFESFKDIKDSLRKLRNKGYIKESRYRKKFILQDFIPNLKDDWKVLIYAEKYFVLNRKTRKNDFRASGSGILNFTENIPSGLLNFSKEVFSLINVPHISLDIIFDGSNFYLIEFQVIYFGTYTIDQSPFYFLHKNGKWETIYKKSIAEEEYASSINSFLDERTI